MTIHELIMGLLAMIASGETKLNSKVKYYDFENGSLEVMSIRTEEDSVILED